MQIGADARLTGASQRNVIRRFIANVMDWGLALMSTEDANRETMRMGVR